LFVSGGGIQQGCCPVLVVYFLANGWISAKLEHGSQKLPESAKYALREQAPFMGKGGVVLTAEVRNDPFGTGKTDFLTKAGTFGPRH
jgi:hypothetical protein